MAQSTKLRLPKIFLAIALILVGLFTDWILSRSGLILWGKNFTSIGLLIGGLVFYSGIVVFVTFLENETILSITLLLPSIVAVAVFVYGFIGWSVRVLVEQVEGPFT